MSELYNTDVLVVGAGTAGAVCAISAARLGLKTILVEKTGLVGGVAATALMGSFANLMVNTHGEVMTGGIIAEILQQMVQAGAMPYDSYSQAVCGKIGAPFTIPFQPVWYTHVLMDLIEKSKVSLLLNTMLTGAKKNTDDTWTLTFCAGLQKIKMRAKVIIDASGNADAAKAMKAQTVQCPSTYGCLMRVGSVNISKTFEYIKAEKPWITDSSYEQWLRQNLSLSNSEPIGKCAHLLDPLSYDHAPMQSKDDKLLTPRRFAYIEKRWRQEGVIYTLELCLLRQLIRKAAQQNDFVLNKQLEKDKGITFNGDGIAFGGWGEGIALCNVAKAYGFNPSDAQQATIAAIETEKYNIMFFKFLQKYVPGFEQCRLLDMGSQTVARVGRTIKGCDESESMLENSLFSQPIYMFGGIYEYQPGTAVAYGKIVSKNVPNLFAVGKCSSHGGQYRSQISCMSMGVAAAAAAKIICTSQCSSHTINKNDLKRQLTEMGVVLHKGVKNNA